MTGRVEIIKNNKWYSVCAQNFTQVTANLVCRDVGFDKAKILAPGSFGSLKSFGTVYKINCNGSEKSLKECKFTIEGKCSSVTINYASLLCIKHDTVPGKLRQYGISMYM